MLQDGRPDLVPRGRPGGDPLFRAEPRGQRDRPVQRHPAHQLGVEEIARLAADLPDPLVLLLPAAGGGVRRGGQEPPRDRVQLAQLLDQPLRGAEQLAVHVQLPLGPRAVAHPHRLAVPPPGQVRQLPLGQVALAADPEHDLQVGPALQLRRCRVGQEAEELVRLVGARRHPQRLHGQAGVADPGVAVVPVPLAADRLGQRRGGRGHDGPGRRERQRLQHPAGMVHQVTPWPLVGLVDRRPGPPAFRRVRQPGRDLVRGPGRQRRIP